MSNSTLLDPLFHHVEAPEFTDRHIAQLAAGTLAAVRIPNFLTPGACTSSLTALDRLPTADYDPARVPTPIVRFGPALNDYRQTDGTLDHGAYWDAAAAARTAWTRAGLRPDPIGIALARLGHAWGAAVTPATISGRPIFGGTLREINNGALVHYDDVNREFDQGLFDQHVVAQLAFNAWIAAPEQGGETTVWRHRWQPSDEQHRDAYGYRPCTVDDRQHVRLAPQAGDGLLFNPANYHAVAANQAGRRIAFAFFLAITTTGQLIAWS